MSLVHLDTKMFGFKCLVCQQYRLLSAKTMSEIKGILAANKGTDDKNLFFNEENTETR